MSVTWAPVNYTPYPNFKVSYNPAHDNIEWAMLVWRQQLSNDTVVMVEFLTGMYHGKPQYYFYVGSEVIDNAGWMFV